MQSSGPVFIVGSSTLQVNHGLTVLGRRWPCGRFRYIWKLVRFRR